MHLHVAQANAAGNALAGAQSSQTEIALRRARQLRETAGKLKAESFELAADVEIDPQTVAMISAWAGSGSAAQQGASAQQGAGSNANPGTEDVEKVQEVRQTSPAAPVSFWA